MTTRPISAMKLPTIDVVDGVRKKEFDEEIRPKGKPVILRGLVKHWSSVNASKHSAKSLAEYLKGLDVGASTPTFIAPPETKGRYFYTEDMHRFTFEKREVPIQATIDKLIDQQRSEAPIGVYAGASPTDSAFPDFGRLNPMPLLGEEVIPKIWIGNSSQIAAHFDTSENIACVVSGERTFVVFPPDQISNLYVGPIDYNMAGQPASMVDFRDIDFERFPHFEKALSSAKIASLSPGDAIYIPSLWWHSVESTGSLNVLVNYWWGAQPHGSPMTVLAIALLVLRDLPENDRKAWEAVFKHYIFSPNAGDAVDHIPEEFRGVLGKASAGRDTRIKAFLRSQLSAVLR